MWKERVVASPVEGQAALAMKKEIRPKFPLSVAPMMDWTH